MMSYITQFGLLALLFLSVIALGGAGSIGIMHPKSPNLSIPSDFRFTCKVFENSSHDVDDIYFSIGTNNISREHYSSVDAFTMALVYPFTRPTKKGGDNFICFAAGNYVDHCHVYADYPPQKLMIEEVFVLNWQNMVVEWSGLYMHVFRVEWIVQWKSSKDTSFKNCTNMVLRNLNQGINGNWMCTIDHEFLKDERETSYLVRIFGQNAVGNTSVESSDMHLGEMLKPGPVKDIEIFTVQSSKISLGWKAPIGGVSQKVLPLIFQINYASQFENAQYHRTMLTKDYHAVLNNLIPNSNYSITVKCQHLQSEKWSTPVNVYAITDESVPGQLPEVTAGSFEIMAVYPNSRDINFHWKGIPTKYQHGQLKSCSLVIAGFGDHFSNEWTDVMLTVYQLEAQSLDKLQVYVTCQTQLGFNNTLMMNPPGLILVPPNNKAPETPDNVTVIGVDVPLVNVSWSKIENVDMDEANVTVYYCQGSMVECTDELHWTHFRAALLSGQVILPSGSYLKNYRFGISVDLPMGSSGIKWVPCTYDIHQYVNPPADIHIEAVNTDNLIIRLKGPICSQAKGHVWGFQLSWCEKLQGKQCEGLVKSKTILNKPGFLHVNIDDLEPGQPYLILARSLAANGNLSVPVYISVRTNEPFQFNSVLAVGGIIGISVAVIVIIVIAGIGVVYCCRKNYGKFQKWLIIPISPPNINNEDPTLADVKEIDQLSDKNEHDEEALQALIARSTDTHIQQKNSKEDTKNRNAAKTLLSGPINDRTIPNHYYKSPDSNVGAMQSSGNRDLDSCDHSSNNHVSVGDFKDKKMLFPAYILSKPNSDPRQNSDTYSDYSTSKTHDSFASSDGYIGSGKEDYSTRPSRSDSEHSYGSSGNPSWYQGHKKKQEKLPLSSEPGEMNSNVTGSGSAAEHENIPKPNNSPSIIAGLFPGINTERKSGSGDRRKVNNLSVKQCPESIRISSNAQLKKPQVSESPIELKPVSQDAKSTSIIQKALLTGPGNSGPNSPHSKQRNLTQMGTDTGQVLVEGETMELQPSVEISNLKVGAPGVRVGSQADCRNEDDIYL